MRKAAPPLALASGLGSGGCAALLLDTAAMPYLVEQGRLATEALLRNNIAARTPGGLAHPPTCNPTSGDIIRAVE